MCAQIWKRGRFCFSPPAEKRPPWPVIEPTSLGSAANALATEPPWWVINSTLAGQSVSYYSTKTTRPIFTFIAYGSQLEWLKCLKLKTASLPELAIRQTYLAESKIAKNFANVRSVNRLTGRVEAPFAQCRQISENRRRVWFCCFGCPYH